MTERKGKNTTIRSKIETLSLILKLGHEACEKKDRDDALSHVTDASMALVRYNSSSVAEFADGKPEILAATAFPPSALNRESEYCRNAKALLKPFAGKLDAPAMVDEEALKSRGAADSAFSALEWFGKSGIETPLLIPLPPPPVAAGRGDRQLVWMLEFRHRPAEGEVSTLALLAKHYAEALWLATAPEKTGRFAKWLRKRSSKFWLAAAAVAVAALFAVRPRLTANARFEIDSIDRSVARAPFQGVVERVGKHDGERVAKGDVVIHLDSSGAALELARAEKALEMAKTELDVARKESFEDNDQLGRLKLLKLDAAKAEIDANIARWKLEQHDIKARQSGILVFDDERKILGARVSRGQKLFAVVDPGEPVARILLDEKDAEVLSGGKPEVTLYLHTNPASGIAAETISVSPKPALVDNGGFRYLIKAKPESNQTVRFGATGTAKIAGPKRPLIYHFMRNFIIWWRKF